MRAAGIKGPKGLRHSFGVASGTAGVPLPTVAEILGQASLTTTALEAEAREFVSHVWTSERSRTRRGGMTHSTFDALAGERIAAMGAPIAGAHVVVGLR